MVEGGTQCYTSGVLQNPRDHRAFKTKAFARLAKKAGIDDGALCKAMAQVQQGQAEDLGGGVWKKRLNDNKDRSIIVAKGARYWIYADLFAKQDKVTIDDAELAVFRKLAGAYAAVTDAQLGRLLETKSLVEICHE